MLSRSSSTCPFSLLISYIIKEEHYLIDLEPFLFNKTIFQERKYGICFPFIYNKTLSIAYYHPEIQFHNVRLKPLLSYISFMFHNINANATIYKDETV